MDDLADLLAQAQAESLRLAKSNRPIPAKMTRLILEAKQLLEQQ